MSRANCLAFVVSLFCTIGLIAADPTPVPLYVAVKTGLVEVQVQATSSSAMPIPATDSPG